MLQVGAPFYRNAQPFVREMACGMHCFAHNGWLPGLLEAPAFLSNRFAPVGETDSEQAFCALLDDLGALWIKSGDIPPLEARLNIVTTFAEQLRQFGPANFLYSDDDAMFAHGDRRKSSVTGEVAAPGLVYLLQDCPPTGATITGNGVSVSAVNQAVALVASVPLSPEPWQEMSKGEVTVFRAGRIPARRMAETA